jgi:hypothetical protein
MAARNDQAMALRDRVSVLDYESQFVIAALLLTKNAGFVAMRVRRVYVAKVGVVRIPLLRIAGSTQDLQVRCIIGAVPISWDDVVYVERHFIVRCAAQLAPITGAF